jgi:hypothetical protein
LGERNVRDAAAVVVDNETGRILAWVGNAGAASRAAAVDGVTAPRQAGSTLKPQLYALALERRLLTAASLLDDSPVDLETATGLYIPQNYDRGFRGAVSVRTALGNSLNVPAVRALLLTGVEPFRQPRRCEFRDLSGRASELGRCGGLLQEADAAGTSGGKDYGPAGVSVADGSGVGIRGACWNDGGAIWGAGCDRVAWRELWRPDASCEAEGSQCVGAL